MPRSVVKHCFWLSLVVFSAACHLSAPAQELSDVPAAASPQRTEGTVEPLPTNRLSGEPGDLWIKLADKALHAVVTITHLGRDREQVGLGTGFIIDETGLIATNRHVLGDARPIEIRFLDGSTAEIESVYASDSSADLAILKIAPESLKQKTLTSLKLADGAAVQRGESVAAIGHPNGLKNSLVVGIVSGSQEIESRELIQVAMPIDHGNSGGPLLNRAGEVVGIITYKSVTLENVGFAMPVAALRPLIDAPNPILMDRWITIGALNPDHWTPLAGANWRQRAGRIHVSGTGQGFGGRSLCLSGQIPAEPELLELGVQVKLDDESGAAGLVFHSDGNHRHYGFYPSAGKLRFSRFDGPDVFSWRVLREVASPAYRPGDWNALQVKVKDSQIACFCNGELVFEIEDDQYSSGRVGLAKFRDTKASFQRFSLGNATEGESLSSDLAAQLKQQLLTSDVDTLLSGEAIEKLREIPEAGDVLIEQEVRRLEQRAEVLRTLARRVHDARVLAQLVQELELPQPDVCRAALLLARYDNPEVDVDAYRETIARMARDVCERFQEKQLTPIEQRQELDRYLFAENGFHGSRTNYYHRSNSYLNEVLDDREGLPVAISTLYLGLCSELKLDVRGIGLPGHYVVCHYDGETPREYIDVFDSAKVLSPLQIQLQLGANPDAQSLLEPQSPSQILARTVRNLKHLAEADEQYDNVLRYLNVLVNIDRDNEIEHRYLRALLLIRNREKSAAQADLNWLQQHAAQQLPPEQLQELLRFAERWLQDSGGQ